MKRYALPIVLFAAAAQAAGSGGVDGTVVDSQTGQVVANARIAIACGAVHKSASADANGHFTVADLPEGTCTMSISGGVYATSTLAVTVTASSIATLLVNVTSRAFLEKQAEETKRREEEWRRHPPMPATAAVSDDHPRPVSIPDVRSS